jgi:ABC-2 type transport system ATP-binding protein
MELHDEGQTILLTTHYMEEADQLCDRVAIMDHGSILALDTPVGLKKTVGSGSIVTVHASGDLTALGEHLCKTVDGVTTWKVVDDHLVLGATSPGGLLPRIVLATEETGATVNDLGVSEPTLETVFINLTGKDLRE